MQSQELLLRKTEAIGSRALQTLSLLLAIAISCGAQTLTIQTGNPLYNGSVNDTYDLRFAALGGTPPYTWAMVSGSLPAGLTLLSSGLLSGIPATNGHASFTLQVTDSANMTQQKTFGISIFPADNRYCNSGNQVNFAGDIADGPASLLQSCYNTLRTATPSPGVGCPAHTSSDLTGILAGTMTCNNGLPLACGNRITLDAGAVYSGTFTFPSLGCDDQHYITVKSAGTNNASWPPEGTRINPCFANVASLPGRPDYSSNCPGGPGKGAPLMAQLLFTGSGGSGPIDLATKNADHYVFLGIEITRQTAPATSITNLVSSGQAHHIVFDQIWCHGVEPASGVFPETSTTFTETARCIDLGQSNHYAVIDSYLNDFYCTGKYGTSCDAQAIVGGIGTTANTGWGTYKIVNNFMEGAAETIEIGGGSGPNTGGIDSPTDLEVRRNHMFKPMQWMPPTGATTAGWPVVKNLYEMKNGVRALVEGNILQNVWAGFSQAGSVFLLTPKNQVGLITVIVNGMKMTQMINLCPNCVVSDVVIRYNHGTTAVQSFQIANGKNSNTMTPGFAQGGHNYSIHNNVIENLLYSPCFACSTATENVPITEAPDVPQSDVLHDVSVSHNTLVEANPGLGTRAALLGLTGAQLPTGLSVNHITFTSNVAAAGVDGTINSKGADDTTNCAFGQQPGLPMINACWSSYAFGGNAIVANTKVWPGTNCLSEPSLSSIFVNYNNGSGGDYHINPASPCHNQANDSTDPGANIDLVNSYTSAVP